MHFSFYEPNTAHVRPLSPKKYCKLQKKVYNNRLCGLQYYIHFMKGKSIMNIFKKAYCRVFQFGFRAAMPLLPYKRPIHLDGIKSIPDALKTEGINSVLLVTDASIYSLNLTKPLEELLASKGIKVTVYNKTVANPTNINVEEARQLYIDNNCTGLIGFGGGSSMDCAKAVGARIAKPKKTLSQMKGVMKVRCKIPPLFAVPTTAGTGSETTVAAIITDAETRHKYCINSFPLIPKYAVLEAEVTKSLPPHITASTGMDALTHAVEAFIGGSTTKETRHDATEAVGLIFENLYKVYENGSDLEARQKMLYASFLAGNAFTKSYVGYVHAIAHSLGGKYNTPHGVANAVLLPYLLEAYGSKIYKKLHTLAIAAKCADENDTDESAAKKFIEAIKKMQVDFKIGNTIKGIDKNDIPTLAKYADKEGNPLYPVPVLMNAKELEAFYYMVMEK